MDAEEKARLRIWGIVFAVAALLLGGLVGAHRFISFGLALGALLVLIATWGLLYAMGAFVAPAPSDEGASREPWRPWRNLGLWVVVVGGALYFPMLGAGGLWDPWETHYGEVARRMLEQDDWISMWWENEWFYSKPVLIMWIDCIGMALVGGNPFPDGQLFGAAWGMRLPVALLAIFCMWAVYHFVSRRFSRRAGGVAALALGSMPTFAFLSHQTMTDMPYVATMSAAICLLILALEEDDDREIRGRIFELGFLGRVLVGPHQALILALVVLVLPFALYLLSRPMSFAWGSMGQDNVRMVGQIVPLPLAVIGLPALIGLAWLLWTLRAERRVRRLYLLAAYALVGLAVLGKVLPGIVLPAMVLFLYLSVTGRWGELKRLELGRGMLVFALVTLPWYLAVVIRHGEPFINRIIFHDIVNRAVVGVHGDTGTMEYYLEQLGYGMFPWLALVPLAIFGFRWRGDGLLDGPSGRSRAFVLIWVVSFFIFFSAVITKFHHYIFPTIVPVAILIGIVFDDLLEGRIKRPEPLLLMGLVLTAIVGRDLARGPGSAKPGYERFVDLFIYKYNRSWPEGDEYDYSGILLGLAVAAVLVAAVLLIPKGRRVLAYGSVVYALIFGFWLMNVYMPNVGDHWSQRNLIEQYYERRDGPEERLVAYQMNWKGENFYTGNRIVVHVSLETEAFESWVRDHQGERHFFITERSRFEGLRSSLNRAVAGAGTRLQEIGAPPGPDRGELCNKFRMGVVTL